MFAHGMKDCQAAVKSFSPSSLGQGHGRGGIAAHVRNRMEVLERVARSSESRPTIGSGSKRHGIKTAQMRMGQRGA